MRPNPEHLFLITAFSTLLLFTYIAMILWLFGKLKATDGFSAKVGEGYSILIPFRNEKSNIPLLLDSLLRQAFDNEWEVIFINDHSEDGGEKLLESLIQSSGKESLKIIHNPEGKQGKKQAIAIGMKEAQGDILIQTDADCTMDKIWLTHVAGEMDESDLVLGPVTMNPGKGFWSNFAALEFMSLQATGAAFTLANKPIIGSAANMAYRKSIAQKGQVSGKGLSSGDDVFLIQSVAAKSPERVKFVLSKSAMVTTNAPADFSEFVNQRARWGSKTLSYTSSLAIIVAALIAFLSIAQVGLFVLAFWLKPLWLVWFSILVLKAVVDYLFLSKYSRITGEQERLKIFLPSALVYPFYICLTGVSMVFKTSWKGRTIQK